MHRLRCTNLRSLDLSGPGARMHRLWCTNLRSLAQVRACTGYGASLARAVHAATSTAQAPVCCYCQMHCRGLARSAQHRVSTASRPYPNNNMQACRTFILRMAVGRCCVAQRCVVEECIQLSHTPHTHTDTHTHILIYYVLTPYLVSGRGPDAHRCEARGHVVDYTLRRRVHDHGRAGCCAAALLGLCRARGEPVRHAHCTGGALP